MALLATRIPTHSPFYCRLRANPLRFSSTSTPAPHVPTSPPFPSATPLPPAKTILKKTHSIRSGLLGMLVGAVVAGGLAYVQLYEDYQSFSATFVQNLTALSNNVASIRQLLIKSEQFALDLKSIQKNTLKPEEFEQYRKQIFQILGRLETENLELKTRIYALEQAATSVPATPSSDKAQKN